MANSDHRKVALIIGNGNYSRSNNKLKQSTKNANELSDLLQTIDFDVRNTYTDIERDDQMNVIVRTFANTIEDGDFVLVYYSGFGYHINKKDYLIPVDDNQIENENDILDFSVNLKHVLQLITEKNRSYATIFILDCSTPYSLKHKSTTNGMIKGIDKDHVDSSFGASIQFISNNNQCKHSNNIFSKTLFDSITAENITVTDIFKRVEDLIYRESNRKQCPLVINQLQEHQQIYFNQVISVVPNILPDARWKSKAVTIIGGLVTNIHCPRGIYVNDKETIFVVDSGHDRIIKYKENGRKVRRISMKNGNKCDYDRLNRPSTMIEDIKSKSLIICDQGHRRILRLNQKTGVYTEIIEKKMACFGVAMDDEGFLYVSDTEKHEVRRYECDHEKGIVVAGGHGQGRRLSQLNYPTYIFVDRKQSVYISDSLNNRVVKWDKDAKEGIIIAGGHGIRKDVHQLFCPAGLIVDQTGTLYVADHWNHRIMRWRNGQIYGEVIAGDRYLGGNTGFSIKSARTSK